MSSQWFSCFSLLLNCAQFRFLPMSIPLLPSFLSPFHAFFTVTSSLFVLSLTHPFDLLLQYELTSCTRQTWCRFVPRVLPGHSVQSLVSMQTLRQRECLGYADSRSSHWSVTGPNFLTSSKSTDISTTSSVMDPYTWWIKYAEVFNMALLNILWTARLS